jgi:hypothetical protein
MNTNQIYTLLSKIIKKKYLPKYKDWHETATYNEKKGISIIKFIIETRGHKKADKTVIEKEATVQDLLNQKFR